MRHTFTTLIYKFCFALIVLRFLIDCVNDSSCLTLAVGIVIEAGSAVTTCLSYERLLTVTLTGALVT